MGGKSSKQKATPTSATSFNYDVSFKSPTGKPDELPDSLRSDSKSCIDMLEGNLKHRLKEFAAVQCEDAESSGKHRKRGTKVLIDSGVHVLVINKKDIQRDGSKITIDARLVPYTEGMRCVAISYRHEGDQCALKLLGGGGHHVDGTQNSDGKESTFPISSNAVDALQTAIDEMPITVAIWLDMVCIPGSGHSIKEALMYMGFVYSCFQSFSQIHWKDPDDFADYASRGWIMQEFLVCESYLTPAMYIQTCEEIEKCRKTGAVIIASLRHLVSTITNPEARREAYEKLQGSMNHFHALLGLESDIVQYWLNDTHGFWVAGMNGLLQELAKDPATKNTAKTESIDEYLQGVLRACKKCMCPPKICLVDRAVLERALGMQTPNANVLGRLEYCYVTSKFSFEEDRSPAIFGVYNALAEQDVKTPMFAGIWPSLRGAQITAKNGSSCLGLNVELLCSSVDDKLDAALCILYEEETKNRRILMLAIPKKETSARALWTYSNLMGDGKDISKDLAQTIVFAEEIDQHFHTKQGTMLTFLNKVMDGGTRPPTRKVACPEQSLYHECLEIGDTPRMID
eukprot:m.133139 g.133139  ORF g.133139 m.133139 type:complete len:571 (-) comp14665_c0_seq1:57-1769(-)